MSAAVRMAGALAGVLVVTVTVVASDQARYRRLASLLRVWHLTPHRGARRAATAAYGLASVLVAVAVVAASEARELGPAGGDTGEGPAIMLVLDVSRSMTVRDVTPDRAAQARTAALRLATTPGMGRVGLVAFAQEAYLLVPPTSDRGLLALYLDALDADAVSGQGSDLSRALEVAREALASGPAGTAVPRGSAALVVLSDGEGFEPGDSLAAATRRLRKAGVVVHTVTLGTPEGGPVPGVGGAQSSARPDAMARLANETGGVAVGTREGTGVAGLEASLAREGSGAKRMPRGDPGRSVPWLVLSALALILLERRLERAVWERAS